MTNSTSGRALTTMITIVGLLLTAIGIGWWIGSVPAGVTFVGIAFVVIGVLGAIGHSSRGE